jgi:hypothetical protein
MNLIQFEGMTVAVIAPEDLEKLEADNARLLEALHIIEVARHDSLTERPDAYELWELQLTREESAKVRAALAEGGAK